MHTAECIAIRRGAGGVGGGGRSLARSHTPGDIRRLERSEDTASGEAAGHPAVAVAALRPMKRIGCTRMRRMRPNGRTIRSSGCWPAGDYPGSSLTWVAGLGDRRRSNPGAGARREVRQKRRQRGRRHAGRLVSPRRATDDRRCLRFTRQAPHPRLAGDLPAPEAFKSHFRHRVQALQQKRPIRASRCGRRGVCRRLSIRRAISGCRRGRDACRAVHRPGNSIWRAGWGTRIRT